MAKKISLHYQTVVFILQLLAAALAIRLISYHFGYRSYIPLLDDIVDFLLTALRLLNNWLEKLSSGFIPWLFP